ncbi:MAG: hypothetical protein DRP13_03180 [Candidatus Aenigmatarchaeota archaeon]|nr:MAG: hypothetical protein DRP18_02350 [Candidatus Aenigmarchaeota archaeon]RLJ07859.1 MAG: hypothetical protein DRP13_03180 [Candidatus Aenigmarchaeota archaeon]RLJ08048.1 MAG: hypothetical protein DRP16_02250 [Candidatus Aenigmarchaeota archaeon]
MLDQSEKRILEILSKDLLVTKGELVNRLSREGLDSVELGLNRLRQMGYIEKVESLGTAFVITQSGMRAMKELTI